MIEPNVTMAQQVAQAARACQQKRTGHMPTSVTVVLSESTLVITLHGALSPAESMLAKSAAGAVQVQEFHRQLFTTGCEPLRQEIARITGVPVRESAAQIEPTSGALVQVFTSGTMVQVFLLSGDIPADIWGESAEPAIEHEGLRKSDTRRAPRRQISADDARQVGAGLGLDWRKVDLEQFRHGLDVELHHGTRDLETNITNDDLAMTGKIAWAHLKQIPDYYMRLDRLETEASAYWAPRPPT